MIKIGTMIKNHGVKGEVKIVPILHHDFNIYKQIKKVFILYKDKKIKLNINSIKRTNKYIVLGFEEIKSIEELTLYLHMDLYILEEDLVKLPEGQYYDHQIKNLKVYDEKNNYIGYVKDILRTKANIIYCIKGLKRDYMIPYIDKCVLNINLNEKKIIVRILNGL